MEVFFPLLFFRYETVSYDAESFSQWEVSLFAVKSAFIHADECHALWSLNL